jgi:hypothetical protein
MGVRPLPALLLVAAVALLIAGLVYLRHDTSPTPAGAATVIGKLAPAISPQRRPAPVSVPTGRPARAPQSFTQRLRCVDVHRFYQHAPPEVQKLLCERRPLAALAIIVPLAEAGDRRALEALALLARCPIPSPAGHRQSVLELARGRGASPETLARLDEVLAQQERGPSAEELDACHQSASEFSKLQPAILQQFAGVLGRSVQTLRGENELDVQIEYQRRTLVAGDADAEENLARDLLQKGTPASQAQAMTLLRAAADASPAAKAELATCLLQGCPTPATDPTEARQLLTEAASAGDLTALLILAGPQGPAAWNPDPDLPMPERYAWTQFLEQLQSQGCFGTAQYATWAASPAAPPGLTAMSPADAQAAQARAETLLASTLPPTRQLLGCD